MTDYQEPLARLESVQKLVALDTQFLPTVSAVTSKFQEIVSPIGVQLTAIGDAVQRMAITPTFQFFRKNEEAGQQVNYTTISKLPLQVPQGFNGNLSAYMKLLAEASQHSEDIITNSMKPFEKFLADIITNKTSMADASKYQFVQSKLAVPREKLNAALGKHFRNGSHETRSQFGKVFGNLRDYYTCVEQCSQLNDWLATVKINDIKKSMQAIVEYSNDLIEMVERKHIEDVSMANLKYLAEVSYDMGRELEFFAILVYRIQVVSATMLDARRIVKT